MEFNIKRSEFVQVLRTGYGHWVTLSTYRCDYFEQIAALLCLPSGIKEINVRYVYIIVLLLFAFASAIAKGDDPSQYTYDQMQMRDHLQFH